MRKRAPVVVLSGAVMLMLTSTAMGQFRGGPPMSPEQQEAAWTVEAHSVAAALKLPEPKAASVAEAYKAARASHGEAMAELRRTAERGPGMFQQMQAINDTERGKLEDKLSGVLNEEQLGTAMESLGTFNNQWDRFVDVLSAFDLSGDNRAKALSLLIDYVIKSDKARSEAMAAMDFQSMRDSMQTLKEELDSQMAEVLSAEQLAVWEEKTARRGGPGGGRGGRGGFGGGGGAARPPGQ